MKFFALLTTIAGVARATTTEDIALPMQTFFLPLPEKDILELTFKKINSAASGDIRSTTSISIGTTGTVIWYDHHEDGFEPVVTAPTQASTQIWGDNDGSNGCAPGVSPCDDANDYLHSGDVFILENDVDTTCTEHCAIVFDGGDRVQASKNIAMTRGEYPAHPGSLLAGAVEVLDTTNWGTYFECPVGQDLPGSDYSYAFQYTAVVIMAGQDGTSVDVTGTSDGTDDHFALNAGESKTIRVKVGAEIFANKAVQVDVLAGDINSTYEMRWFSLLPLEDWSTSYLSPVGHTGEQVKCMIYNPNEHNDITVLYQQSESASPKSITIHPKSADRTTTLGSGQGTYFWSNGVSEKFMVFCLIDTNGSGQIFDWGFPVQPVEDLSSQVLVGWAYGCTDNDCADSTKNVGMSNDHDDPRTVVWVAPLEACTFEVDFDGDGNIDYSFSAGKWESVTISDPIDDDMTGAMIYCKAADGNTPIKFAAAWGQDPDKSFSNDEKALDLGTAIPPYHCERTVKFACLLEDDNNNGMMDVGESCDVLTRTIDVCQDTTTDVRTIEPCEHATDYDETDICLIIPPTTPPATTTTDPTTTTTATSTTTSTTTSHIPKAGGGGGDPHFARWGRKHDSFHGECDLVLLHSESFHNGVGFDLHVRTTILDYFSYIETAALRVGEYTLQVWPNKFSLNGIEVATSALPWTFGEEHKYTISELPATARQNPKFYQYYKVDLDGQSEVIFKFYKEFLTVSISGHQEDFGDSVGLMGDFETGNMVSRDGIVMNDFKEYGFEWQVAPTDPKLFVDVRGPQLPFESCRLPTGARPARRRLRADRQLTAQAQVACAHVEGSDFDLCVDDVLQTGDIGLADTW
uniref:VWFD domain-containing protein n=1 Tax=Amphora coffeiformis TaxID=265554 RepID=A0A7S3LJI9_9STRA